MSDVGIKQRKLRVTLETVTPMFLAGADKNVPELRAPSFIGALRYWTRAALGGVLGDKNLEALRIAEEEIWGSTKGSGAIRVRLENVPNIAGKPENPLPHKKMVAFESIPAKTKFSLTFTQLSGSPETWEMAIFSFLLMVTYGGVGRRSRRGWGTVWIVNADTQQAGLLAPVSGLMLLPSRKYRQKELTADLWKRYRGRITQLAVEVTINFIKTLGLSEATQEQKMPTAFPIINNAMVYEVNNRYFNEPVDAIKKFGTTEHNFGPGSEFGSISPRWASPLWVRVLPVSSPREGYVLALSILKSKGPRNLDNYERLTKFLQAISNGGGR